jgi:hypothetical protein
VRSALHPKAKACLAAIDGASRQGAYIVICESDLSTLVQALKMSEYDLSDFDEIIFYRRGWNGPMSSLIMAEDGVC